jgi:hypothetical protein
VAADAAGTVAEVTTHAAETAETHAAVSLGARIGFALDGVLHLAMGWAGLRIAWGAYGSTADESGALTSISDTVGGRASLWVGVVGFSVVALWNLARAISGRHCHNGFKRLEHAADGIAYVTVAWSAAAFAVGSGRDQPAVDGEPHRDAPRDAGGPGPRGGGRAGRGRGGGLQHLVRVDA